MHPHFAHRGSGMWDPQTAQDGWWSAAGDTTGTSVEGSINGAGHIRYFSHFHFVVSSSTVLASVRQNGGTVIATQ